MGIDAPRSIRGLESPPMDMARALALTWRCLLAIALIAGPPVALGSPHPVDAAPAADQAMPCHPVKTPPAEPPCGDGCCPAPDCDPGVCRIAAPGVFAIVL